MLALCCVHYVDINLPTENGFTALHYAAKYLPRICKENEAADDLDAASTEVTKNSSSSRAIHLLLSKGADVNATDDDGQTPLAVACQRGNRFGVESLLMAAEIDINKCDKQGSTALHEACENGSKKITEMLLNRGAQISIANEDKVIPLHIACHEGCTEVVKALLFHGHQQNIVRKLVSATDNQGSTALHYAIESGVQSTVEAILKSNANPIAEKDNQATPLHIAARGGHIGIADLLLQLQSHVDINIIEMTDREQNTPLHFAARHNQCEMIQYLVEK